MTTVSTTIANMMTGSDGDFADRRGPGDRKKYTVSGPVRPAVIFNHNPFEYSGEFLRVTNQE